MEEISAENLVELKKRYKVTVFIVSAQIFSAVIFSVAGFVLTRESFPSAESYLTLWLVILFLSAATFVLRRQFFSWERLKNTALLKGVSGAISSLQIKTVLLNSVAEIVIVLGFVICFLSGNFIDMLRALGIALIVFCVQFSAPLDVGKDRFELGKSLAS